MSTDIRENRSDFSRALARARKYISILGDYSTFEPEAKRDKIETARFNILVELILDQNQQIEKLESEIRNLKGQTSVVDEDKIVKAFGKLKISDKVISKPETEYKYFKTRPA